MAERREGGGVGWGGTFLNLPVSVCSVEVKGFRSGWVKQSPRRLRGCDRERTGCPRKELSSSDLGKFHPVVPRELAEDTQNHCSFSLENKKERGQVSENCGWKTIISERIRVVTSRGWDL